MSDATQSVRAADRPSTAAVDTWRDPTSPAVGVARPARTEPARVLVLGLGNDILRDDAVGLVVVRAVRRLLRGHADVEVVDTEEMGLSLLDFIAGYRDLVIVDSIQTGKAAPGTLHEIDDDALCLLPRISPHFLGVGEILALGRQLGLAMPERVKIFAIEVEDPFTLDTELTAAVAAAVAGTVDRVATHAASLAAA